MAIGKGIEVQSDFMLLMSAIALRRRSLQNG